MASAPNPAAKLAHVRPVRPLRFPASEPREEHLGQHPRHYDLCALIVAVLRRLCGEDNAVSADMFVYYHAADERYCRAPDAAVKLGLAMATMREHGSWKTWELGVPEVVVEVLSVSDTPEKWTFTEKLEAYAQLGVRELVAFDLDAPEAQRLRVWDRLEGDFVERVVETERTTCAVLSAAFGADLEWAVVPHAIYPAALRLLRDGALVLTETEDALQRAKAAEARLREVEAKLRELEGP